VGLRKVLLEHALPQNWTKAKGKNGRLSYFLFHRKQQKVVQSFFLWVILFLMENLEETLRWFLKLYFQWQQGGVVVKEWLENSLFFGYSQWKQKGGGGGMLMVKSNPQLTIGNGP
jgi:hypothetical protein